MLNVNKINLRNSTVIEAGKPKKIKTKAEDFERISNKQFVETMFGLINDAEKVNLTEMREEAKKEIPEVQVEMEKVVEHDVKVEDTNVVAPVVDEDAVDYKTEIEPVAEVPAKDDINEVSSSEHVYSFEKEPLKDLPKWREARQTVTKQMPDTASTNDYSVSADFNLEMAAKNAPENSFEGRVYESGLKIINLLKQEKKKLESELSSGERSYADQLRDYELQIAQLEANFKSQIAQLEATFKSQKESLEKKVVSTKEESDDYSSSMNKKIEDKNREISTKRNEIKAAGVEAKKADALAKQQQQLAEEQAQIITGIEKFSPELLTPVKVVNLSGNNEGLPNNVFTQIREAEENASRTM